MSDTCVLHVKYWNQSICACIACMCIHVYTCCYICKFWNQSICACIACIGIHVYTCCYICKFWNQSICACIVCIGIHVYTCCCICNTLLCVGAHNRPETSLEGAATSGPHSGQPWAAVLPLYPAIRDPFPHPFWRTRARCTRRGGPKLPPCTAHGPSNHNGHSMIPSWAPSELIWVGGAAHRRRVRQQQHPKTPSWHWLYVYVCVCMCMYLKCPSHCMYVYVCVYTCACIVCIVCMCLYVVCIVCIRPGKHWCHHNRPSTPPGEAATSGPHSGQPWAAAPPLYPAVRDPFPDPFWRTRARCTRRGGQSCPPAQPMGPPITMGTWWSRPEPRPSWSG